MSFELESKNVIDRKFVKDKMELNAEFLNFHLNRKTRVRQLEFNKLHF